MYGTEPETSFGISCEEFFAAIYLCCGGAKVSRQGRSPYLEHEPRQQEYLHLPLLEGLKLEEIFCLKELRMILDGYVIARRGNRSS